MCDCDKWRQLCQSAFDDLAITYAGRCDSFYKEMILPITLESLAAQLYPGKDWLAMTFQRNVELEKGRS